MKLLCIGKSGQVAQALAERSAAAGADCVCLGRPELDLLNGDQVAAALDRESPTVVVNAAAYTNVDDAEADRDAAFALNADAVAALAKLCAARDLPLIHLSTDYVFDGSGETPWRENDLTGPLNVYGASKLAGEQAVQAAGGAHVILRTSWVYSPFGGNFIKTMLRLARESAGASVVDDQFGSPTSALDIADTILRIADRLSQQPTTDLYGIYHHTAAGIASWADVAGLIFEIYEQRHGCKIKLKRIPTSDYPTPAERPRNSRLNTDKITETFGVMPQDWRSTVTETVERLLDERAKVG